jgi:hypothetical protein
MPSGVGGYVGLPGNKRLDVRNWRFRKSADTQDNSDTGGEGWHTREATLKDSNGSCEVVFKPNIILEDDLTLDIGDTVEAVFNIGSTGKAYAGEIIIKDIETINDATGPIIMQNLTWEGTGPMTGPTF